MLGGKKKKSLKKNRSEKTVLFLFTFIQLTVLEWWVVNLIENKDFQNNL